MPTDPFLVAERAIRKLVRDAIARGATARDIEAQIADYLGKATADLADTLREELQAKGEEQHQWITERVISDAARRDAIAIMGKAEGSYADMGNTTNRKVLRAVQAGLRQDETISQIEGRIRQALRAEQHVAATIARTAVGALDRADTMRKAALAGVTHYQYTGPKPQRKFCADHYGKQYTEAEIAKLSNGMGLSVRLYCGGWRCRHYWEPVL